MNHGPEDGGLVDLVEYEIEIAARASVVYRHLTTEDGLERWIAADVDVEPTPGGTLRWTHENGATMVGRFVELVPDRRLVFTYGWEGDLMGLPPGSSTVEIELEERHGSTILRLTHRGVPAAALEDHRRGWVYFLGRLADALGGNGDREGRSRPSEPQTWHYGLVARWWAEFNLDGPEIEYFRRFVEAGQPALDLACGTGRLLIPYLKAGLDVDGCDISADMLAFCRERAEREGLSPSLYVQPMHELDLPRKYGTIIVCGGFGLGGNREHDVEALRRIHDHLEPGGTFVVDNEVPYRDPDAWRYWPKSARAELPEPFEDPRGRRTASDGTEIELRSRVVAFDPLDQRMTMEMLATAYRDGVVIEQGTHLLTLTVYFTHEIVLMLEAAGFVHVELRGDYTDEPPTGDTDFVVFHARKP